VKLSFEPTPSGNKIHLVVRYKALDWDNEPPTEYEAEETACGIDTYLFNSPELGEMSFKYCDKPPIYNPMFCRTCKSAYEDETKSLGRWNKMMAP
jgi:hypothetical protein